MRTREALLKTIRSAALLKLNSAARKDETMHDTNIAIVGKNPVPYLLEMEDCDFRTNFPYANPKANYILNTSDHMTPREFVKFLLQNHIGIVLVASDFSFDCSAEHCSAEEIKAAIEKVFHVLWECPHTQAPKCKRK